MRDTPVGNVLSWLLGKSLEAGADPLHDAIMIIAGAMFGILVIGLLLLVLKFFGHWGYEQISIIRGRDSLDVPQGSSSAPLAGMRRRRRLRRLKLDRRKDRSS